MNQAIQPTSSADRVVWDLSDLYSGADDVRIAQDLDAALKRATENRPQQHLVTYPPGPNTLAAMKRSNLQNVDELIRAIEQGTTVVDPVVLDEIKVRRDEAARRASEYALLEATEQKFGAKQEYAKTIGNWARGVQNKFVDEFVLQRQEDAHTKINRIKVRRANFSGNG